MKKAYSFYYLKALLSSVFILVLLGIAKAQTPQQLAFPEAEGFGRFTQGARGVANPEVYIVTNLNDSGSGSFREAVSKPGRFVVFAVGGIIRLASDVNVAPNTTIAGQTAPGEGIVLFNKRVTFSGSSNTIARYLRIRLGATSNSGKDASGLSNGANMIFDHMSITWGMDEVFSINWDGKGTSIDNITVQNSIIGQGLHRENHSAGGLIQTPDGGKVSLIKNLYISNKTRNPKVKGVNEFVNNVIYNWGNGNRLGDKMNYGWSGEGYIMGGSSGISEVNIINNYFVGGPLTPPSEATPFSRGTPTFFVYGAGNYFDNNKNGVLDGSVVPFDETGYPGIEGDAFKTEAFPYPAANPALTAAQAYEWVINNVGANYPRRDQVDQLLVDEVKSRGIEGYYVYRESDLPFSNGGLGEVFNAPAPLDTDKDGMPDAWEDANGLDKNNAADAVIYNTTHAGYLNIEVYVNSLINTTPPAFIKAPTAISFSATSNELPAPNSEIVLTWKDNADNEEFFVLERSGDGTSYTEIAQLPANTTTYTDRADLLPNQTYYYRVKAVSATGSSTFSEASVKTPPIPAAPAAATSPAPSNNFQYAELADGKLTLRWTGSANTEKYKVYVGTTPDNLTEVAEIAYTANPTYEVSGLSEYVTYYWRVDAINYKGTTDGEVWTFRTTKDFPVGLVGHWSFDETAEDGTQIYDSSDYLNHGILGLDDDDQSIRVSGKVNNALDFATASPEMYVVSIPHQDQLYLDKNSFSISFWMKADPALLPQDNSTSSYLLCKGSITKNATTGATGKRFDIEFKNKQIRFAIDDDVKGKDELQADGTPFFTGDWVHVVAIRDVTNKKLQLYLNGVFVKEVSISNAINGIGEASALVVGNIGELEFLSTANKPAPYKGKLDELKIFNHTLSGQQILELFHTSPLPLQAYEPSVPNNMQLEGYENVKLTWNGGINTSLYKLYMGTSEDNLTFVADVPLSDPSYTIENPETNATYFWRVDAIGSKGTTTGEVWSFKAGAPKGLVGHWKLDETSGTLATDNSNYNHSASITSVGEALWAPDGGKFGGGLAFKEPTSTGAITVPHADHLLFDNNAFTISMWVKIKENTYNYSSGGDTYLIHKGTFESKTGKWYGIQLRDSRLTFAIDDGINKSSVTVSVNTSALNLFTNEWKHIVAIRDTDTKQIKLYIDGVLVGQSGYSTGTIGKSDPITIGNSAEKKPFRDLMDDVRLYNYALSESEIAALNIGAPLVAKATDPLPANEAESINPGNIELKWEGDAQTYNVLLGTSEDNLQLIKSGLTAPTCIAPACTELTKYFWRVDAIRDGETATGDIWSFTVEDKIPPVASAQNIVVTLAGGGITIIPEQIDNGSTDAYGIASLALDKTTFNCTNLGENKVTLTVTDNNNNIATTTATVTVVGAVPIPGVEVIRTDDTFTGADANTILLGYGAQEVILSATDYSAPEEVSYSWSPATGLSNAAVANPTFAPSEAGTYNFMVTATNMYGCQATTSVTITVRDVRSGVKLDKVAVCHDNSVISVSPEAVPAHLAHGCSLGACHSTSSTAALTQQPDNTQFEVYPTLISGEATIELSLVEPESKYNLELYNMRGQLLKIIAIGNSNGRKQLHYKLNSSDYAPGIYLIKLSTENKVLTKRIVVN